MAIHMILTTTSMPLASPPSYLKLQMPSFSVFQYAPDAACMPRLPALEGSVKSSDPTGLGSERCWMIVLFTANLKGGCESAAASAGRDSEMRDWRILF